jgi:hypothetical protein
MKIKRWNAGTSTWVEDAPDVYIANIIASGTPSSSNFLRGDGAWATPTGDVTGPASSVNARIATFNGTTGKVIQDSGTLISGLATSTHTHGNISNAGAISSATQTVAINDQLLIRDVSNSNLISNGPVFGTSATTFLSNNGNWLAPLQSYGFSRLANPVVGATASTAASLVFSFSLVAGTYRFESVGFICKSGATSSRRYEVMFTCDDITGYSNISAFSMHSINSLSNQNLGLGLGNLNTSRIDVVSSATTAVSGTCFTGSTVTTAIASIPYYVVGTLTVTQTRTFRMHIRQSAGSSLDFVAVNANSYMQISKLS